MKIDVEYVATYRQCDLNKKSRSSRAPLQKFQAGYPGDSVHLNIQGPFLESYTGHKYVLITVDQFNRWLEKVSLATQDAESVAMALFEACVVYFGVPWCVHTDQGRNFDSELFQTFCLLFEAAKREQLCIDQAQTDKLKNIISWFSIFWYAFGPTTVTVGQPSTIFGHECTIYGESKHWIHN